MAKPDLFREQNKIGSFITLYLQGGKTVTGKVESVAEDYVVLCNDKNQLTFFFEVIGGWSPLDSHDTVEKDYPSKHESPDLKTPPPDQAIFGIFKSKPNIELPEVNFSIDGLDGDDIQELVRAKNKYEYAIKIRELSRLHTIIPPLLRLAERIENPDLYCLCSLLKLKLGETEDAEDFIKKSMIDPKSDSFIVLAYLESIRNNWEQCASNLLNAAYLRAEKGQPFQKIIEDLGKALGQCNDKELVGLYILIQYHGDTRDLALLVAAFAIYDKYPEAASLVLQNKIAEARDLAINSPIFEGYTPPEAIKHEITIPIASPIPSTGSTLQFGYISAVYVRDWKFFGFIRDEARGETFYFDRAHVIDKELQKEIWENKAGQKVDFIPAKSIAPDKKYRMALEVKRSGIDILPQLTEPRKPITVPSKTAPAYEKARIAESLDNLEEAGRYYLEEISIKGPYWQSAVMDLSTLLNRQGKTEEALILLDQHASSMIKKDRVLNQKITFLMAAKQFERAADIINKLVKSTDIVATRKNTLLKQLSYCQYKLGKYNDAITTIKKLPQDSSNRQFIQRIEQAKKTPVIAESTSALLIDRELSQWTSGISAFARHLLDNFDDRYIDERSRARGYYDEKDFQALDIFFERIRGKRPGEKGKVLLTLAAMCEKAPEAAGNRNTLDYLRRSLTFMGEAALTDVAHNDIARCYLTEAATMSTEHEVLIPLAFLLSTYLSNKPAPGSIARPDGNVYLIDSVNRLVQDTEGLSRFEKDFIYYSTLSAGATAGLEKIIKKSSSKLLSVLGDKNELQKRRDAEMERLRRERNILMTIADFDYSAASSFIDAANQLRDQAAETRFEMDRIRLNTLSNIAKDGAAYIHEPDYVERERKFLRLSQEIARFSEEIKYEPTKITIELVLPILEQMEKDLRGNFEAFVAKSAVHLTLANVLENDYYIPEENGNVRVRISVKSASGGAPIEGLEITAEELHGLSVVESGLSPELFRGGEEREIELTIKPSSEQIADAAFSLQCVVKYRKRNGDLVQLDKQALPVRIGSPENFSPIPNPYKEYAGGRSVDRSEMFIGRKELLDRILDVVNADGSGQCFVLYGQKRSGKTSVLKQLRKRIKPPLLCAEISVGALETASDDTGNNFYQLCLDRIQEALDDAVGEGNYDWWPEPIEIQAKPLDVFRKTIRNVKTALEKAGWFSPHLILLIDEFTYLYEYIVEGVLPSTFMRQWKALLQSEMFNAVLVGQDSMPKFKQAYPNEFGITYDERITYLSKDEAILLAEAPILLGGLSRYRGRALDRLLQLTAGSPFYMQIFCDRLVRYMNQKLASFITEADIDMVASLLTTGAEALPIERFDPLITAAGESVAETAREKYLQLLSNIATKSDAITGARPSDLPSIEKKEAILRDLQERDVIVSDAEGRIKIRVQLFQEWLKTHSDFMDAEVLA